MGMKVLDLGLARTRVPVRRAREFMERTKVAESFIRRAVVVVVVDIFAGIGDGDGWLWWLRLWFGCELVYWNEEVGL